LQNTEADDLIATYALAAVREGAEVVIATNDKDILQLVSPSIRIYSTANTDSPPGSYALLGEAEVQAKWGVPPSRIADVLALTGDTSDNIPGIPGIGGKTALALVSEHGSVENLIANPEKIANPRVREKIVGAREQILANREMVRLDEDLPLPAPWNSFTIQPDYPALIEALRDCEFKSLLQEIETEAAKSGIVASSTPAQQELF